MSKGKMTALPKVGQMILRRIRKRNWPVVPRVLTSVLMPEGAPGKTVFGASKASDGFWQCRQKSLFP